MDRVLSHPPRTLSPPSSLLARPHTAPLPPACSFSSPERRWSPSSKGVEKSAPLLCFERPKHALWPLHAASTPWDSGNDSFLRGHAWDPDRLNADCTALVRRQSIEDGNPAAASGSPFETFSQDMAMGLILRAASGTGWTTGSGLEGPSSTFGLSQGQTSGEAGEQRWPWLSKSPRRSMRVAFTCNVCGERTTRAINPHAYTDGTVFVQCAGCNIFHKLVDNLNLFHELKGRIFPGYGEADYVQHQPYDFLGLDDFPLS